VRVMASGSNLAAEISLRKKRALYTMNSMIVQTFLPGVC
jgi:hypothetical protein